MNGLAWGRGSLIVDGGVVSVLLLLGIAVGASSAIEAFAVLNIVGFGALSGIVSGVGAVRVIGPLVGGIAFASQTGCRMTAEIGAMRIADEIDAVEAMASQADTVRGRYSPGRRARVCHSGIPIDAGDDFLRHGHGHPVCFIGSPGGTYNHYFVEFLTPTDLAYSVIKVAVFARR